MKNRYQVGDLLGRGGMGQVHSARHRAGHLVAIKQVRNTLSADPVLADRLANEARLLRRVVHPNVVRAVEQGHDAATGAPYLVMDRAHGTPLDRIIATTGPLPQARVAKLAKQLLAGLGAIHAAGIVHADVKSSNIMVSDDDRVVIIDFGLARTMSRTDLRGLIAGTPAYISPEVIDGSAATVASDIYGAGAVIYEMLTGQLPWSGPAAVVLMCQAEGIVMAPSQRAIGAGITPELDMVILRALSLDPKERQANAATLAAELAVALEDSESTMPSIELIELTATRDFWGGIKTTEMAPRAVDATAQAANTRPLDGVADPEARIDVALERVRCLLDKPDLEAAAKVLVDALAALRGPAATSGASYDAPPASDGDVPPSAWRLESVLAALYDRLGRFEAASRVAKAALAHAQRTSSESAKLRTRELVFRIERRARNTLARGSRPIRKRP